MPPFVPVEASAATAGGVVSLRVPVPIADRSFWTAAVAAFVRPSGSGVAIVIPDSADFSALGRLAVVVDPEAGRHDHEQPLRVEGFQLDAEEVRVDVLPVEQARDGTEILLGGDHGDLDPEARLVRRRDGRRQLCRGIGRGLRVREEDILEVEDVARRVAVGARRLTREPGDGGGREGDGDEPAHHVILNAEQERVLRFPALSIAIPQ